MSIVIPDLTATGDLPVDRTEREFEQLLDRRTERRALGPYERPSLEELVRNLEGFLDATLTGAHRIRDPHWFVGGASKIQAGFHLEWRDEDGDHDERLVLRMEPAESLNVTSRLREYELMTTVAPIVPVPRMYWVDATAEHFPEPALIYGFSQGVSKPSGARTGQITGLGTDFGAKYRALLAPQFVDHLARIHALDTSEMTFRSMDRPRVDTTDAALWQLNRARRVWVEDKGAAFPLMEVAADWLERNAPTTDAVSVIHGDYRSGNFLFSEESGEILAWLDWERGHLGDRHRDLAWTMQLPFGHFDETGRYLVCGLVPEDEFLDRYSAASGLEVDHERLRYFRILNCYQIVVAVLATSQRVVELGRSHQDIMLARLRGEVGVIAEDLRRQLKEVLV